MVERIVQWWSAQRARAWRRWHVPLPGVSGWIERVIDYAAVVAGGNIWSEGNIAGAPVEWSLLERRDDKLVALASMCAVTGKAIDGRVLLDDNGGAVLNGYGVRCARCGLPLCVQEAGMKTVADIPSCPACRPLVRVVAFLAPILT